MNKDELRKLAQQILDQLDAEPKIDVSLSASLDREEGRSWSDTSCDYPSKCDCRSCDRKRVHEAARRWDEKKSKPFPWSCTCGEEFYPDQKLFTCKSCNSEWGNPWYEYKPADNPARVEGWEVCETCDDTGEVHSHNPSCWDCTGGKRRVVETSKPDTTHYEQDVGALYDGGWQRGYKYWIERLTKKVERNNP